MDKFRVDVIAKTPNPQQVVYQAMHQDYSSNFVSDKKPPSETECGDIIVNRLLKGNRGHYGCYDSQTEILTDKGWVYFSELDLDSRVLAVSTNGSHFEQLRAYQRYHVEKDTLFHVNHDSVNLSVTYDHRMLLKDKSWNVRLAYEIDKPFTYALATNLQQQREDLSLESFAEIETLNNPSQFLKVKQSVLTRLIGDKYPAKITGLSYESLSIIQAACHLNNLSAHFTQTDDAWELTVTKQIEAKIPIAYNSWTPYEGMVYCVTTTTGFVMVRRNHKVVICGNCLEHPQITFNCGYFPHSVVQQARTHRIGVSMDVQSMRYTGEHIYKLFTPCLYEEKDESDMTEELESIFYLRPVGHYKDRKGKEYFYSEKDRKQDLHWCYLSALRYAMKYASGQSEEHARGVALPFDYRQHFVVSFNCRSLMHFLDLRHKPDAQLEIQKLTQLMLPHFVGWVPAVAKWYIDKRLNKGLLAP